MTSTQSNSPLQETMLELVFMPQSTYDITFPGEFFNAVKEEFPEKVERSIGSISVPPLENGNISIDGNLTVFKSTKSKKQIQLGRDILIINMVDYHSWEDWKRQVREIIELYRSSKKTELQLRHVNLGFMNKFEVPSSQIYDVISFKLPNPEGENYSSVLALRTQVDFPRGEDNVLTKGFRLLPSSEEQEMQFLLELSYANNKPLSLEFGESLDIWLEEAHTEIISLFGNSVKQEYLATLV